MRVEVVVEPVVAELVEASKRPQEKTNEDRGFDRLSHRSLLILKIDFRANIKSRATFYQRFSYKSSFL